MNNLKKISAVIIVKNAEQTIARTLESLKAFDEVLIFDNGSMDKTLPIVGKYANVKIVMGHFIGFGETKNIAANHARNNWILSIDSDEVISPELLFSIKQIELKPDNIYGFERFNYYRKKRVRFSGWRKETIYRLYDKNTTKFNNKKVHESLKLDNFKTILIKGELKHYSYKKISDFNRKRALYSDLFAEENKGKRKSSSLRAVISGIYDFINTYFFRLGFLDGYRGLLISFSNSSVTFIKYLKLYEANLNNDIKTSLIITTYSRPDVLKKTLESVLYQTVTPDEIIIADDGLKVESRNLIDTFSEYCFIPISFYSKVKTGNSIILFEKAILKSKYEYLVSINGDTVLHKNYIHDHVCNAKKGNFITGQNLVIDYKPASKLDGEINKPNLIVSNFRKVLHSIFSGSFLFKSKKPFSNEVQSGYSFYKDDYTFSNNTQKVSNVSVNDTIFERLNTIGLKRKKLKFSGIQYLIREKSNNVDIDQKRKILVSLDRLKLLNCGLGQVAVNYGRALLDVKTNAFEFNFLLPTKGFVEFENKIAHTKLNFFRSFFSNYMKPYDLCHITHQLPSFSFGKARRNILTIHDLNFVYTKSKSKKRKYLRSIQNNIYKSDAIVFISEFTKQVAYEYLNIPGDKIVRVIYNGVRPPVEYKHRPSWLPEKKFVFSIGQFLEKKNFHVLLPFLKHLPEDYILVIAGENNTSYGHKMEQIAAELNLSDRIIFPGGISEEHKSFLYHNCQAFLFPSIAEGFGLPIIEAMLCSKPVFCSDRTSLREIGSEFAFFWKNFDPTNMLEVFRKGLVRFNENDYKEKQKEYANTFTYKRNVSEYIKLYEELLQ
ncbi:MAG: glycosyltransferase [Bacteroidota bacterium]